jgi:hypothetical protein
MFYTSDPWVTLAVLFILGWYSIDHAARRRRRR